MSGHTNRNRRNGGNSRSRHGAQRQRGSGGQATPPNNRPKGDAQSSAPGQPQSGERNTPKNAHRPPRMTQPPAPLSAQPEPSGNERMPASGDDSAPDEPRNDQKANTSHGRSPFGAASPGRHAYIPAGGLRPGMNGQHGQNGHNGHHSANGHTPTGRHTEPPALAKDEYESYGDSATTVPKTWRFERLNGGTDTTPRETFRPESRGEIGPLIDSLHELFAQDRVVASRGDSTRCGICYLHFPLSTLEYRESEGFYVCAGCQRALGPHQVMMVRRQQSQNEG